LKTQYSKIMMRRKWN